MSGLRHSWHGISWHERGSPTGGRCTVRWQTTDRRPRHFLSVDAFADSLSGALIARRIPASAGCFTVAQSCQGSSVRLASQDFVSALLSPALVAEIFAITASMDCCNVSAVAWAAASLARRSVFSWTAVTVSP